LDGLFLKPTKKSRHFLAKVAASCGKKCGKTEKLRQKNWHQIRQEKAKFVSKPLTKIVKIHALRKIAKKLEIWTKKLAKNANYWPKIGKKWKISRKTAKVAKSRGK